MDGIFARDDDVEGIFGGGGGGGPLKTMLRKQCKRVCKVEKLRVVCTPISKIGAGFDDEYFDDDEVRLRQAWLVVFD